MIALDILYREHRDLLRLSQELITVTLGAEPPTAAALIAARRALAQAVAQHLMHEGAMLLAPLNASADALHRELARRYSGGLLPMREQSARHHSRWTTDAILKDLSGYRASARGLIRGLEERIAWEEAEVFPVVARMAQAA